MPVSPLFTRQPASTLRALTHCRAPEATRRWPEFAARPSVVGNLARIGRFTRGATQEFT
ncbi:hypothetical protein SCATT_56000 [Streptantibioticus cattleyicolor NRRL 8057 = DSM 46488]|uniref:Uncharacterized protein n=1 Tax=Streptantibioticus cattleyicolor (strain ATCC 35852 / DSM 46488 / JCM 4925 / NBRC 14057 / NRRL 8057) TaxID=1003195 RepID=G8X1A3_STREN|nr:hypothetical protein SCATT_56000 [Streptantibioticus cattleyicolor NRRL 8057 = DSM 46488]